MFKHGEACVLLIYRNEVEVNYQKTGITVFKQLV